MVILYQMFQMKNAINAKKILFVAANTHFLINTLDNTPPIKYTTK